jgi:hypothetical protein
MEDFSKDTIKEYIAEFLELYDKRPIFKNDGGMKSHHCFWVWYFLRKLQPEVVIESGIWMGQSTWLIEQACPNSRIISIDPNLHYRSYISSRAEYTTTDFNKLNWKQILNNKTTLAFIDDHQDNFKRLEHAHKHGIKYMIFEDNYPTNHGDVLSLKKILSNNYHILDVGGVRTKHQIPVLYKSRVLQMCEYNECPPIYLDSIKTRWNNTFAEHNCKPPVFDKLEDNLELFKKDQLDYTFIAFVKVLN